ncbi:MAG: transposase, partial [Tibeticola sp.]|nr:transposase [Tibeticola sp.]
IEHRLTRPRRPQTNGMVERFNGRIEEVLRSHHFTSGEDLERTIARYVWLYNHQLPQGDTQRTNTPGRHATVVPKPGSEATISEFFAECRREMVNRCY